MPYKITGQTFEHREYLKQIGAVWDQRSRSWNARRLAPHEREKLSKLVGVMLSKTEDAEYEPREIKLPPIITQEDVDEVIDAIVRGRGDPEPIIRNGSTEMFGDDPTYFNHFADQNPTAFFGFSSLAKLVEFVKAAPEDERKGSRATGWLGSQGFTGTTSMQETFDLVRNGWPEGVENAEKVAEALELEHARRRKRRYSVSGGSVSVGRMMAGNPAHMRHHPKQPGKRVATLFIDAAALSSIKTHNIIARAAVTTAIVNMMEAEGYSCEIVSILTMRKAGRTSVAHQVAVTLKQAGEALNLNDVIFALGHPSFLRRLIFATVCRSMATRSEWQSQGSEGETFNDRHQPAQSEFYVKRLEPHHQRRLTGTDTLSRALEMFNIIKPDGLPIQFAEEENE